MKSPKILLLIVIFVIHSGLFVACGQSSSSDSSIEEPENGRQVTADVDTDGDGFSDLNDNCNDLANDQHDEDDDGYGDECDADPNDPNVPDPE